MSPLDLLSILKEYFSCLQVDPNLLQSYQSGLVIGLIVVTTFSIFPGKPWGIQYGKEDTHEKEESANQAAQAAANDKAPDTSSTRTATSTTVENHNTDLFSPRQLEMIQQRFGLSREEVTQMVHRAQREASTTTNTEKEWTPHQRLNAMVYLVLIGALVLSINRDYNGACTKLLMKLFPKEAMTLFGFTNQVSEEETIASTP